MNRDFLGGIGRGAASDEKRNIFSMPAYSSVFLQKDNLKIDHGDKIVLPPAVLETLSTHATAETHTRTHAHTRHMRGS
jgi:hypothetical protein